MIDQSTLDLLAMILVAVVVGAAVPLLLARRRGRPGPADRLTEQPTEEPVEPPPL